MHIRAVVEDPSFPATYFALARFTLIPLAFKPEVILTVESAHRPGRAVRSEPLARSAMRLHPDIVFGDNPDFHDRLLIAADGAIANRMGEGNITSLAESDINPLRFSLAKSVLFHELGEGRKPRMGVIVVGLDKSVP